MTLFYMENEHIEEKLFVCRPTPVVDLQSFTIAVVIFFVTERAQL